MQSILFFESDLKEQKYFKKMFAKASDKYSVTFHDRRETIYPILRKHDFDILIVNIHDTGLNGLDFMTRIGKEKPDMIRIALSDTEDQLVMMKASVAAHQYISKPYDWESITESIKRFTRVQDLMENSKLRMLMSQMKNLPSPPIVYTQLMRMLESDNFSLSEVGELIEQDIGLSAEILRVVNSAQFSIGKEIVSPSQAVSLLGVNMIKDLMLTTALFSQYEGKQLRGISFKSIWNHGLAIAVQVNPVVLAIEEKPVSGSN